MGGRKKAGDRPKSSTKPGDAKDPPLRGGNQEGLETPRLNIVRVGDTFFLYLPSTVFGTYQKLSQPFLMNDWLRGLKEKA